MFFLFLSRLQLQLTQAHCYSGIRIYSRLFQNSHSVRMSIKRLFHFWNNGRRFTRRKAVPLQHFSRFVVEKALSSCEFSIFLQPAEIVCESLDFLRDTHCYYFPHVFFLEFSPLNSFFCPFVVTVKLTVKCLLCSTKCVSFSQHFSPLDAMFVSSERMTSLFRFIPSILFPRAECLEYILCIPESE